MKPTKWWQYGVFGSVVLSACALVKAVFAIPRFFAEDVPWRDLIYFPLQVVVLGFTCGLAVWAVRPLWKRFGIFGDVVTGIVVIETLFLGCMLIFQPDMLFKNPRDGVLMICLGVGFGAFGGYITGRDLRKVLAAQVDKSQPPNH